jgi:ADP-heptose:LPS heptosyltransferase
MPGLAPMARHLKVPLGDRLIDLVGRTDAVEAFALLRRASLVVTEDSGLMHMAWVAGAPTLGLFGASSGARTRPHGSHSDWVRACERADGACIDGTCLEGSRSCLARLPAEIVIKRAQALMSAVAGKQPVIYADGRAYAPPMDA